MHYPESEKWGEVKPEADTLTEFLDWLSGKGIMLGKHVLPEGYRNQVFAPLATNVQDLIYEYFEVDYNLLETERRQMLEAFRASASTAVLEGTENTVSLDGPVEVLEADNDGKVLG